MGVKDLWPVLAPICEKKSLWELQNKVIAVDLSAWICDSQCSSKQQQINMYLRTSYLLLLGAKPVFILEGKAPDLKAKTILCRQKKIKVLENEKSKDCSEINQKRLLQRSRLKSLQKQCSELLCCLGVSTITAPGEAEAFCAQLNKHKLVDGVVSQDSDAFLYGATDVYRNFQMGPKYTYDAYSMDDIEKKLGLSRTKLIGFSMLSGCDYSDGLFNVGKELALKFLTSIPDEHIIDRFLSWKHGTKSVTSCEAPSDSETMTVEMKLREKALQNENFPNLDIIAEFTSDSGPMHLDYKWNKPDLRGFMLLAGKKLMWDEEYSIKKIAPLMGRWHLENNGADCGVNAVAIASAFGKNSHYKVTWDLFDITTLESKDLVQKSYPKLVAEYEEGRLVKKSKRTGNVKKSGNKEKVVETDGSLISGKIATNVNRMATGEYDEDVELTTDECNYLNLSGIIKEIITRPSSNPALNHLPQLL